MKKEHKEAWIARLKANPPWFEGIFALKVDGELCGCAIGQLLIAVPVPGMKLEIEKGGTRYRDLTGNEVMTAKLNRTARDFYGLSMMEEHEIESISDGQCRNSWEPVIQYIETKL